MTHGPDQAILGLGDESDSYSFANMGASQTEFDAHLADAADAHDASAISVLDSAGWTANTDVEAVLAEVLSRLPKADTLAADYTIDTDATTNATNLSIPVKVSQVFAFELIAVVTASTNCGVRLGFAVPTNTTMEFTAFIYPADDTVAIQPGGDQTNEVTYIAAALAEDVIRVVGRINVGDTAGNFVVKCAQNTSHGDTTTLHAESTLVLTPIV